MKSGKYKILGTIVDDRKSIISKHSGEIGREDTRSRSFVVEGDEGGVYLCNTKFMKLNKVDDNSTV